MADEKPKPRPSERDEPVKIDLDPEVALKALVKVEPTEATGSNKAPPRTSQ